MLKKHPYFCPAEGGPGLGPGPAGLEFWKMSTAIPSFFAVANAFFNLNFPHSQWQKNCVLRQFALSALVKFEPCRPGCRPGENEHESCLHYIK
jgi:hypothetical protein